MTDNDKKPGDEAAPNTPQSAEHICRRCDGRGRLEQGPCPSCRGTGKVTVPIGDA
jgi:DnaJ-class molecular chaperone